jgi:YHS domain-containing protein
MILHTAPLRFLVPIGLAAILAACESAKPAPAQSEPSSASVPLPPVASSDLPPTDLTLVTDTSQVCMVNNQFMGRPQIPVQVEGKTYYGCCAMCKARLQSDASARTAIDPVSHTPVDKATAVVGKMANGSALYFASRDHFESYARRARSP